MKIGELAAAAATQIETIRFYEREGLIPSTERSAGNYRVYGDSHVQRLVFIRRCRSLDMGLDEIRALLSFVDQPEADCGAVDRVLDDHIGHVAARISELQALEGELRDLRAKCVAVRAGQACGILTQLGQASSDEPTARPASAIHLHVGGAHHRRSSAKA